MGALVIDGLSFEIQRQDGAIAVVDGVTASVPRGTIVGVTGPADSGWRALLRLAAGLHVPTAGRVLLPGRAGAASTDPFTRRQEVVFASALDPLLELGVGNALRGLRTLSASRSRGAAGMATSDAFDLAGVAARSPRDGFGAAERVRLCLALAASLRPEFIAVEVARNATEGDGRPRLIAVMRRICVLGPGVLLGTQDEILLAAAARSVLIFEDGKVLAEGAPAEILGAAWAAARRLGVT